MLTQSTPFAQIKTRMKRRMLLVLPAAILFLGGLGKVTAVAQSPIPPSARPNLKTIVLPIDRMVCPACVANVRRAIKALDGVLDVEVSLERKAAQVTFDPSKLAAEHIAAAVNRLGYRAGTPRDINRVVFGASVTRLLGLAVHPWCLLAQAAANQSVPRFSLPLGEP